MKAFLGILAVAFLSIATTSLAAGPRITTSRIEKDRAVLQGEIDPDHTLVLRIDDGSAKPRDSVSWANKSGEFEYVFQLTDRLRLEGGKTGIGIEASCTVGNANSIAYLPGKFILRPKATVDKDGSVVFADLHGDDGRTSPVSLRIDEEKFPPRE